MAEKTKELDITKEIQIKLFGNLDQNMKKIEKRYNVSILNRDDKIKIIGEETSAEKAKRVLDALIKLCDSRDSLTEQDIDYCLAMNETDEVEKVVELDNDIITRTILGKPIKAKTVKQKDYVNSIDNNISSIKNDINNINNNNPY